MEEYAVGDGENPQPDVSIFKEVFSPIKTEVDKELLPFFNYDVSSGEIWVISYARQNPDFACVIDEAFGRNICDLFGVKVIGTIGIVRKMKDSKILVLDELKTIRDRIRKCRFYLSKELLRQLDLICIS
jgi:predicted nucleic acid-binding protein